jgi:hypothetical protein
MPSKQVVDSQKSAMSVVAVAETQGRAVADAIGPMLQPHLSSGETMPDVALLISVLGRYLKATADTMVERDYVHDAELRDDAAPRERRDDAALRLYAKLVELREVIGGIYGSGSLRAAGFEGETPRDPVMLSRFARNVSAGLRTAAMPTPRVDGANFDRSRVADQTDTLRAELDAALEEVATELREAQGTLAARDAAVVAYQQAFSRTANALRALLEMASMDELATKVRPSSRRPGRAEAEPAESEPTAPAEPAAG